MLYGFAKFTQWSVLLFVPSVVEACEAGCVYGVSVHDVCTVSHYPWHDGVVHVDCPVVVLEDLCSQCSYLSKEGAVRSLYSSL